MEWSCFCKQILEKSSHKPSVTYTIDRREIQSDWCSDGDVRAAARAHNKQQTQQCSCSSMLKFLFGNKLFQDTPVQERHENFVKQVSVITVLLLLIVPISQLAAEGQCPRLTALSSVRIIVSCIMRHHYT